MNLRNELAIFVKDYSLNTKRSMFQNLEDFSEPLFPRLREEDLYLIACGGYLLRLAPSYYAQHNKDKQLSIKACKDIRSYISKLSEYETSNCTHPLLLKCGIFSRFSNQTKYLFYILVDFSEQFRTD